MPATSYDFQGKTFCPNGAESVWGTTATFITAGDFASLIDSKPNDPTSIVVYPNPAAETIHIFLTNKGEIRSVEVTLFDMNGRQVLQTTNEINSGENKISLKIDHLVSGLYSLAVRNSSGKVKKFNIIKK